MILLGLVVWPAAAYGKFMPPNVVLDLYFGDPLT
jgi:hypothetical protein